MKTRNFLLTGLAIAAASTLASCDKPNDKLTLYDIYNSMCDQCVSIYQDTLLSDIQCSPTLIAPNTNKDCNYTVLKFDLNSDKVNYILPKNLNAILTSCGFTYDDYKTLYSKKYKEHIIIENLFLDSVVSELGTTRTTLEESNLETISKEKGYYYSDELINIFEDSMYYTYTHEAEIDSEKHKYYICSLTNTLIKGNSLMEITDSSLRFVYHDHLSKTYIAQLYEQNKNNPTKIEGV